MKKRILALLLMVAMLLITIPVSAVQSEAEGTPAFVVKTVEAAAGETVDVTISVENNPGIASIKLEAKYDANLTLNSITYNSGIGGMFMQPQKLVSPVILNWFNGAANSEGDWVFATLSFTVSDSAAAGTYPISITYEADDVYNIDLDNLDFAIENGGVTVVCRHTNKTEMPAKSADCENPGNNLYYTCDACGAVFQADGVTETTVEAETISALGHDLSEATCTEAAKCQREGCEYTEGEALGHSFTNYVSNGDATCTADGTKTAKCDRCDVTDAVTDTGSAKGHAWKDATCTEPKTCTVCGVTEGIALGHSYSDTWNKGEDGHWHECTVCGDKVDIAKHDFGDAGDTCKICGYERDHVHRLTLVPAVAATCTADGNKAYYICSGCQDWFEDSTGNVKIEDHDDVVIKALGHDYVAVVTAPTCTEKGYTTYTCSRCNDSYTSDEVSALGHSFTNYVSNSDATCTEDGTKTAKCDRCDVTDTVTDTGSAKGHAWKDATCTEPKTCTVCDVTEGEALGHSFTNYVSNGDATCTEDGTKTAKCDRCDVTDTVTDTDSAKGHDYADATCTAPKTCKVCGATEGEALSHNYVAVVTAPTCTEKGYTTHTCSRCNDSYVDTYVDAQGHSYSDTWSKGEDGHWHECTVCGGKTDFEEHDFGDAGDTCLICEYERSHVHRLTLVPEVGATCTEAGKKAYYTCSGCQDWFEDSTGNVKIEDHDDVVIEALGHDYDAVVTAPTCTEKGYTTYTCSRCDDSYVGSYVDALGHDYVAVVTDPTCTEQGYTTHTCSRCNDSYVDTYVDALGHDYVAVVTAPTCTEQGYTTHTCSRCNDSYVDTYVDAQGHSYSDAWSQGDATGHWHTCERCGGHDTPEAHVPGPEATEDDPQVCTICGYVIQPALGHTHSMKKVEGHDATCTEAGQKTYYVCEGCGKWFEDEDGNTEIADHDDVILPAAGHDWQDATCTDPKTCKACGVTEGQANGHTASGWNSDESSHWKVCTVCETVIEDSKADHADGNGDGKCDTCAYVMVQSYPMLEGTGSTWTVGSDSTLTFCAGGEFSLFAGVEVDGAAVDPDNYTVDADSMTVTLKAEYLKTLAVGKHEVTIVFSNGTASADFEVKAAATQPADDGQVKTGDSANTMLWMTLLLISAAAIAVLTVCGRKKRYCGKYVK